MRGADYRVYLAPLETGFSSRALLRRCASIHTGADQTAAVVARTPAGKPYFTGIPGLHFSVSHSGDWWACCMGAAPLGLDLQEHAVCNQASISRRFFAPEEDAWLRETAYRDFFAVWAAKESLVKFTGQGMSEESLQVPVVRGGRVTEALPGATLRFLPAPMGYTLCLCAERIGNVEIIYLENH